MSCTYVGARCPEAMSGPQVPCTYSRGRSSEVSGHLHLREMNSTYARSSRELGDLHLRNVNYTYARSSEASGDLHQAKSTYSKSSGELGDLDLHNVNYTYARSSEKSGDVHQVNCTYARSSEASGDLHQVNHTYARSSEASGDLHQVNCTYARSSEASGDLHQVNHTYARSSEASGDLHQVNHTYARSSEASGDLHQVNHTYARSSEASGDLHQVNHTYARSSEKLGGRPTYLILLLILCMTGEVTAGLPGPDFVGQISNVTVTAGRDAVLTCTVEHLRGYKVAWVQVETQTILTIHTSVITRNPRVGLSHEGHTVYRLHLKEVTEADRGYYMCQINTDPMINQKGFLQVVVPPDIEDTAWTGDLVVREGTNVSLECRALGYPPPVVTWRREDPLDPTHHSVKVLEGPILTIGKVSRLHMGAYLCVASNGIQPSVSKRIQLNVQFPPMLWIPNQLEGARGGDNIMLKCNTEAFPNSINYWTNHKGEMIAASTKYETTLEEESYKTNMRLVIHNLTKEDFNTYKCIAKNSLGETDGSIKLYEIEPRSPKEDSTQGSQTTGPAGERGESSGEDAEGNLINHSSSEDMEKNYTTGRRGRPRGKQTTSKKNAGRGPNSWRTGEAVNEVYSEVDLVFREKDYGNTKDSPGRIDKSSSYDHSFSYDSGTITTTTAQLALICLLPARIL
ncbi:uncharacterized protein [Cherax quadricarinatus]|uniref:uncharacterized protein isoform X2 n=1 Tax=Cherax quadricarinatus TaxID=27406 RepID=UPI00387E7A10